jgi:hypothetical protein
MQTLTEQSRKQRETFGVLARGTWDAYRGFFPSPFRFYERAMETVESLTTTHGVDTAQKMVHQEKQLVHSAKK